MSITANLSVCHPHGYELDAWGFNFLPSDEAIFFKLSRFVITEIRPGFSLCCILLKIENGDETAVYVWRDDQGLFRKV